MESAQAFRNLDLEFTALREHLQRMNEVEMSKLELDATMEVLSYLQVIYRCDPTKINDVAKAFALLQADLGAKINPLSRATPETDALVQGALDLMRLSGAPQEDLDRAEASTSLLQLRDPGRAATRPVPHSQ